jgi:hypothetical protein
MTSLSGIKVPDFSHPVAGPYRTLLLADHGAGSIRSSLQTGGDTAGSREPPFAGGPASYFIDLNRGKQSVSVKLKCAQGIEPCLRMVERADIVTGNFRTRYDVPPWLGLWSRRRKESPNRLLFDFRIWTERALARRTRDGFDFAGFQRSDGDECYRNDGRKTRTLRLFSRRCEHRNVCSDRNLDGAEESRRLWSGIVRG